MSSLILSSCLCLGMLLLLTSYIKTCSKKYYKGNMPSSLSATYYNTGWVFRAVLVSLGLLLYYPVLIYNGTPEVATTLGYISKIALWLSISGIIGVSLFADFRKKESVMHYVTAGGFCAAGALIGTMCTPFYIGAIAIWLLNILYWLVYKKFQCKKQGKKYEFGWTIEAVAFYSTAMCLGILPWLFLI